MRIQAQQVVSSIAVSMTVEGHLTNPAISEGTVFWGDARGHLRASSQSPLVQSQEALSSPSMMLNDPRRMSTVGVLADSRLRIVVKNRSLSLLALDPVTDT